ncbi:MAG: hypothetical protein GC161_13905 [Planctomycetaceae bacterium]|nr:hypothetical protein [Planctomycetaceae bacterium]
MAEISTGRKVAYYAGMGMIALGFVVFLGNMFCASSRMDDFDAMQVGRSSRGLNMGAGLFGVVLLIGGGLLVKVGRLGVAGAGVVLEPQQARKDLEPYSRMAGGMLKDALEETGGVLGAKESVAVRVRCRACAALNMEEAKFCQACGQPI